jgi:hypothetical protein
MARPRGGRIKGTATMAVETVGVSGIRKALAPWLEPELTAELDVATKRAAQTLAKDLRSEARPVSKHMAKAVRVKRARTGKPGWIVGSRRKVAFFWHMVIRGTKSHGPRKAKALVFVPGWTPYIGASSHGVGNGVVRVSRVKGVDPNPIVERVARRGETRAAAGIDADMTRATGT